MNNIVGLGSFVENKNRPSFMSLAESDEHSQKLNKGDRRVSY